MPLVDAFSEFIFPLETRRRLGDSKHNAVWDFGTLARKADFVAVA